MKLGACSKHKVANMLKVVSRSSKVIRRQISSVVSQWILVHIAIKECREWKRSFQGHQMLSKVESLGVRVIKYELMLMTIFFENLVLNLYLDWYSQMPLICPPNPSSPFLFPLFLLFPLYHLPVFTSSPIPPVHPLPPLSCSPHPAHSFVILPHPLLLHPSLPLTPSSQPPPVTTNYSPCLCLVSTTLLV